MRKTCLQGSDSRLLQLLRPSSSAAVKGRWLSARRGWPRVTNTHAQAHTHTQAVIISRTNKGTDFQICRVDGWVVQKCGEKRQRSPDAHRQLQWQLRPSCVTDYITTFFREKVTTIILEHPFTFTLAVAMATSNPLTEFMRAGTQWRSLRKRDAATRLPFFGSTRDATRSPPAPGPLVGFSTSSLSLFSARVLWFSRLVEHLYTFCKVTQQWTQRRCFWVIPFLDVHSKYLRSSVFNNEYPVHKHSHTERYRTGSILQ